MRYHVSSMSMNDAPTSADAAGGNQRAISGDAPAVSTSAAVGRLASTSGVPVAADALRESDRAMTPTSTLTSAAIHNVMRVPSTSRRRKLASKVPTTAPSVLTP
jgi:hypothetical protein